MEIASLAKMAFALSAVIGLIALVAFMARRLGLCEGNTTLRRDNKRLKILETMSLDAKRRVLLICCDGKEHLILLGTNSELVLPPHAAQGQPMVLASHSQTELPELHAHNAASAQHASRPIQTIDAKRREPSLGTIPFPKAPE